jgi:hypothetical protein
MMARATIGQAAKEAVCFTGGLIVFALLLVGAILLAGPIQHVAGNAGLLAEMVLLIFVIMLVGRLIHDRI